MIHSVQEATATRICAAENCGNDAEPRSRLCWKCEAKDSVRLHVAPIIDTTTPTLPCCTCHAFKPDADFTAQRTPKASGRRYRNGECKACSAWRRRIQRAQNPKQRCAAINHTNKTRRKGQQCSAYVTKDSPYCTTHTKHYAGAA